MKTEALTLSDSEIEALRAARELLLEQARRERAADNAEFYPPTSDELIAIADELDGWAARARRSVEGLPPDHPFVEPALRRASARTRVAGWMRRRATD